MSRAIANELYAQGVLLKHIAEHLGVSHQRVSQLITVPRRGRGNTGRQNPAHHPMPTPVEATRQLTNVDFSPPKSVVLECASSPRKSQELDPIWEPNR